MNKIILASTSPRRKKLLENADIKFDIIPPDYDENIINKPFSYNLIENVAENKGKSAAKKAAHDSIIISADTAVIYNNIILGKPKDFDDAYRILMLLNGNMHKVVTSVCIYDVAKNKSIIKSETSEVIFNKLSSDRIQGYITKYNPYDKAGAYGIQELPEGFIKEIKGDYDNIVGLPVKMLKNMLEEINLL